MPLTSIPIRDTPPVTIPDTSPGPSANGHHPPAGPPAPTALPRRSPLRVIIAGVPVFAVNLCAFFGQLAFIRDHLPWPMVGQVLVALTLESIAVYIAYHAHVAQREDDPAFRLRLSANLVALVIATLNYSHFAAPHWRPTAAAVTFGLLSAVSPWLWGIHSRRESRDALKARGLIEPHAVRLGATRWLWHPIRCARVYWLATWEGINTPSEAIAAWEARRTTHDMPAMDVSPELLRAMSPRERLLFAFGRLDAIDSAAAPRLLESMGAPIDASGAREYRRQLEKAARPDGETGS